MLFLNGHYSLQTSNRTVQVQEPSGSFSGPVSKGANESATADNKSKAKPRKPNQTFSAELKTQIAEYAVKNGNRDTILHFKATMNIDIPDSTLRGFKRKFLNKRPMVEVLEEQMKMLRKQEELRRQSTS